MYKLLTPKQVEAIGKIKDQLNESELAQYIYSRGCYDVEFFVDYFLSGYKTDKKTGEVIKSAPFHKTLIEQLKSADDTVVVIPRDHAKSTTNFFVLMHDICYGIEPSILLIMAKGLGLETIGKIRDEFETNPLIQMVFGRMTPERTKQDANKKRTQNQLQFMNGVTIESVTMGGSIRGKRPTKIVVDDPQENSDVMNSAVTDKFNAWFFSSVYNTLDPSGKCVVIGTVVGNLCLVNFLIQEGRGFEAIKYEAIKGMVIEDGSIVDGEPLRPEKWSIAALDDRYKTIGHDIFMQEYMNLPYVLNGSPVFSHKIVDSLPEISYSVDDKYSGLYIYKPFDKDKEYLLGCDTAEGGSNGDFSTIVVRDRDLNLVATYRDRIPPDKLCLVIDRIVELGFYGVVGVEVNNTGISTVTEARNYDRYHMLFSERTVDKISNKSTKKYGRHTNTKTKPIMILELEKLIREGNITEFSKESKSELKTYYYDEKGSTNAISPNHDDLVIAEAICVQMRKKVNATII